MKADFATSASNQLATQLGQNIEKQLKEAVMNKRGTAYNWVKRS